MVGADPDELERLAAGAPGQAFALQHVARALERDAVRHHRRSPTTVVHVAPTVGRLRHLAERILELDGWVRSVAAALRDADATPLRAGLLVLGAGHPLAAGRPPTTPPAHALRSLRDEDLEALAAVPRLPAAWRDPVHRERLRRWIGGIGARVAEVPDDDVGLLARWVDTWVVDRLSPIVDLHPTADEERDRLSREVDAAAGLLTTDDLSVWSFTADDPPTLRVAFGDPATATHLAVLLPGTSTGLHAADTSLADARALHDATTRAAPPGVHVATILDLYAAPTDLGRAADPAPAERAGAATAAFLDDLPTRPRTTLVGHSYGALTAARASDRHAVDDLVLLGAPGAGVATRDDLPGARRVWAARAARDPIGVVADLDELLAALPPRWRPSGPLADPLVAHGPDPTDPEFGARRLPTAAIGAGIAGPAARGHVDYLRPGTVSLTNVARVVVGLPLAPRTAGPTVRRARPPRRDRPASAADG